MLNDMMKNIVSDMHQLLKKFNVGSDQNQGPKQSEEPMSLIDKLKMNKPKVNQDEVLKATIFGVASFLSFEGNNDGKIDKAV